MEKGQTLSTWAARWPRLELLSNNVCLHIHSTDNFLCWQSMLPELRSLFRFPQLRPERLFTSRSVVLFPFLLSPFQIESAALRLRNPLFIEFGSLSWFAVAMATVKCNRTRWQKLLFCTKSNYSVLCSLCCLPTLRVQHCLTLFLKCFASGQKYRQKHHMQTDWFIYSLNELSHRCSGC